MSRQPCSRLQEWALADDGGKRVVRHTITVLVWTICVLLIGWLIGRLVNLGLRRVELTSDLLRRFILKWSTRIGAIIGFLIGLSEIGTNMTPILAGLGAVGFILAFLIAKYDQ